MKKECAFVGNELLDLLEDVNSIRDQLLHGEDFSSARKVVNETLAAMESSGIVDEKLVADIKKQFHSVEEGLNLGELSASQGVNRLGSVNHTIREALLTTLVECECECKQGVLEKGVEKAKGLAGKAYEHKGEILKGAVTVAPLLLV
jgi:hypothetical protein